MGRRECRCARRTGNSSIADHVQRSNTVVVEVHTGQAWEGQTQVQHRGDRLMISRNKAGGAIGEVGGEQSFCDGVLYRRESGQHSRWTT
jgi:hypothetical protein